MMKHFIRIIFILLITVDSFAQADVDILIVNGRILDGSGNSWYYGDVAIKNGKILKVGRFDSISSNKLIDAKNAIVAPGFIDVHTHIEGGELRTPTADNFIYDGVTTVITGNCGSSQVDIAKYLRFIDSLQPSINVATLIGHNDVRKSVMGTANRIPGEEELKKMEELVRSGLRNGAVGFSSGLIYIPGTYSKTEEIIRLATAASSEGGVYVTHMRSEGDSITQAISEAIRIGREARIPVQISHFKVSGQQNWKRSDQTIEMIRAARKSGIDVTIDQYPYTASSTSMSTMLPDDVLADGPDSIKARLQRPEVSNYVVRSMLKNLKKRKLKHFSYAVVTNFKADTSLNGKSIEAINLLKGRKHRAREEAATVIDMMLQGGAGMVFHGMSEWDVTNIMRYPFNMFASDAGIPAYGQGVPHPRGYGTNARVLGKYVRDENILTLEEAIRKMTSLPAQKFQLKDRGLLKEGMAADIVIFDPNEIIDKASFEKPHAYSAGFKYVIVNGQLTIENGMHTGIRNGKALSNHFKSRKHQLE